MSDPYAGEIRMFGGNYAPQGWFFCSGQYLEIAQYQLLFAVINTIYGGNGHTNFQLPDLRGMAPLHWGSSQGPGLSQHFIGQKGYGYKKVVSYHSMPAHTHTVNASGNPASSATPGETVLPAQAYKASGPAPTRNKDLYCDYDQSAEVSLNPAAVETTGNNTGQPLTLSNYQPFQACSFIICWDGEYPPRS